MAVQDDAREQQLAALFNLRIKKDRTRADEDAWLVLDEMDLPFELKSTSKKSVTTARDVGLDHLTKWRTRHWIVGFYDGTGTDLRYSVYASPAVMRPWIEQKASYIQPDYDLATLMPPCVTIETVHKILGTKEVYSRSDAASVQKKQYSKMEYESLMDMDEGYSPSRMREILRDRCEYLLKRGSTLNNPHIPGEVFENCDRITEDHAARLRELVRKYLAES